MNNDSLEWLNRAQSNLKRGDIKSYKDTSGVYLEDLCFDLQQAAEKSLKALLVSHHIDFPKTHHIEELVDLLIDNGIDVPEEIKDSVILTPYAVKTRYPYFGKISDEKYKEAFVVANNVFKWVKEKLEG